MPQSSFDAAQRSPDWLVRPFERSNLAPGWLGLGLAIAWTLGLGIIHTIAHYTIAPAELPFGAAWINWTSTVDGAILGLLFWGNAHLHLGVVADIHGLRPVLPERDAPFGNLANDIRNLSASTRWMVTIAGMAGGFAAATLDPGLRDLHDHLSPTDPRYVVFVVQNILFGVLGTRLFATEVHMTRAYARLGARVEVDLLDLSTLHIFARKGLRSVVVWVLISSALSMFWLLESAGQANASIAVAVLALVTVALVAPTLGVHRSIGIAKVKELARVTQAIREERNATLTPRQAHAPPEDSRLGNLIQYQTFVKSLKEWPFDLSIASRSLLLILLGAGSWVGGAIVERLLNVLVD
jgi:hypothetical protein